MKTLMISGKEVAIFHGSEFGQDDGWYFQVETAPGSNTYGVDNGPFASEEEAIEEQARNRVNSIPELRQHEDTIFYAWPEWDEHMEWVATAPTAEIVDWAEAIKTEAQQGDERPWPYPHTLPPH